MRRGSEREGVRVEANLVQEFDQNLQANNPLRVPSVCLSGKKQKSAPLLLLHERLELPPPATFFQVRGGWVNMSKSG